tara:strand:- start:6047 stop:6655 length:609 start_codon:yes stop_codon:yes gene_type:complete
MNSVEQTYHALSLTPSDINEHLPILKRYAEECDHITEMGVRWVVSTFAFAVAKPNTFVSIDIIDPRSDFENWNSFWQSGQKLNDIIQYCAENNVNYSFVLGDTTKITINETDLLFIDTLHEYEQIKKELHLHGNKSRKYIIFHDTECFKFRNERNPDVYGKSNEDKLGIVPAIEEFLQLNPHWKVHEVFTNCNGLTVLKRNH